ncbi:hypothetical protein AU381_26055 [Sinorhizobium glycinis]|uniref:Uncharacterized protein n=1 Tax=Sinorhizobium glycinis TaxID=1472378 RepID=A0A178XIY5_9HYPH|nr:hypothetical protein AU381_26055 [Sinorhizobium glycinis]
MTTLRYDLRRELDGTWTVFDVFTGRPAVLDADNGGERFAAGLHSNEASDVLQLLNFEDALRRGIPLWLKRRR